MNLAEFQSIFSEGLLLSDDLGNAHVLKFLSESTKVDVAIGFEAYRNNWRTALTNALADFFIATRSLLDEGNFFLVARNFVESHHAKVSDLNCYGSEFPQYIKDEFEELPYLGDVAKLDWLWHKVFYCRDDKIMDYDEIQRKLNLDPDEIFLIASNSLNLLTSNYPVLDIWNFATLESDENVDDCDQDEESEFSDCDSDFDPLGKEEASYAYVIWRQGYERKVLPVDEGEKILIDGIVNGCSYEKIMDRLFLSNCDPEKLLALAVKRRWIVGIKEGNE